MKKNNYIQPIYWEDDFVRYSPMVAEFSRTADGKLKLQKKHYIDANTFDNLTNFKVVDDFEYYSPNGCRKGEIKKHRAFFCNLRPRTLKEIEEDGRFSYDGTPPVSIDALMLRISELPSVKRLTEYDIKNSFDEFKTVAKFEKIYPKWAMLRGFKHDREPIPRLLLLVWLAQKRGVDWRAYQEKVINSQPKESTAKTILKHTEDLYGINQLSDLNRASL